MTTAVIAVPPLIHPVLGLLTLGRSDDGHSATLRLFGLVGLGGR